MELHGVLRPLANDLPMEVQAFTQFLRTLVASLGIPPDQYGSEAFDDSDAMTRYLDGSVIPPRTVLDALIQDLAVKRGAVLDPEAERQARELHSAALRIVDNAPGRVEALRTELGAATGKLEEIVQREKELVNQVREQQARLQSGTLSQNDFRVRQIEVHDELQRIRRRRERTAADRDEVAERLAAAIRHAESVREPAPPSPPAKPAGARFAGAFEQPPPAPRSPAPPPAQPGPGEPAAPLPTGARFGGPQSDRKRGSRREKDKKEKDRQQRRPAAAGERPDGQEPPVPRHRHGKPRGRTDTRGDSGGAPSGGSPWSESGAQVRPGSAEDGYSAHQTAHELAGALGRLRHEGRVQEAQALVWEAAAWPPEHFPLLLAALSDAGQDTDAAMLLWEISSRSPQEVAAFSAWLVKAERDDDWRELLAQTASRPHEAVAATAVALANAGWYEQVDMMFGVMVRARPPEKIAELAADLVYAEAHECLRGLLREIDKTPRRRRLMITAGLRLAGLPDSAADLPD